MLPAPLLSTNLSVENPVALSLGSFTTAETAQQHSSSVGHVYFVNIAIFRFIESDKLCRTL